MDDDYLRLVECNGELYEIFIGVDIGFPPGEQLVLKITKQVEEPTGSNEGLLPFWTKSIKYFIGEAEATWAKIREKENPNYIKHWLLRRWGIELKLRRLDWELDYLAYRLAVAEISTKVEVDMGSTDKGVRYRSLIWRIIAGAEARKCVN